MAAPERATPAHPNELPDWLGELPQPKGTAPLPPWKIPAVVADILERNEPVTELEALKMAREQLIGFESTEEAAITSFYQEAGGFLKMSEVAVLPLRWKTDRDQMLQIRHGEAAVIGKAAQVLRTRPANLQTLVDETLRFHKLAHRKKPSRIVQRACQEARTQVHAEAELSEKSREFAEALTHNALNHIAEEPSRLHDAPYRQGLSDIIRDVEQGFPHTPVVERNVLMLLWFTREDHTPEDAAGLAQGFRQRLREIEGIVDPVKREHEYKRYEDLLKAARGWDHGYWFESSYSSLRDELYMTATSEVSTIFLQEHVPQLPALEQQWKYRDPDRVIKLLNDYLQRLSFPVAIRELEMNGCDVRVIVIAPPERVSDEMNVKIMQKKVSGEQVDDESYEPWFRIEIGGRSAIVGPCNLDKHLVNNGKKEIINYHSSDQRVRHVYGGSIESIETTRLLVIFHEALDMYAAQREPEMFDMLKNSLGDHLTRSLNIRCNDLSSGGALLRWGPTNGSNG